MMARLDWLVRFARKALRIEDAVKQQLEPPSPSTNLSAQRDAYSYLKCALAGDFEGVQCVLREAEISALLLELSKISVYSMAAVTPDVSAYIGGCLEKLMLAELGRDQ